jgi:hypothetical protein
MRAGWLFMPDILPFTILKPNFVAITTRSRAPLPSAFSARASSCSL